MFAKSVFFLVPLVSLFQKINLTLMIMLFNQGSLVSIKVLLSAIYFFIIFPSELFPFPIGRIVVMLLYVLK